MPTARVADATRASISGTDRFSILGLSFISTALAGSHTLGALLLQVAVATAAAAAAGLRDGPLLVVSLPFFIIILFVWVRRNRG